MISSLSLWEWIKIFGSLFLFFFPGLSLLHLFPKKKTFWFPLVIIVAFGVSLGIWIILLIWFQLLNITVNKWVVRVFFLLCLGCWIVGVIKNRQEVLRCLKEKQLYSDFLIIGFSILILFAYLYFYRDLLGGMGSDSMHHTLISSLIQKQGQLPRDYGSYAPVTTFSYHFGYHTFIAALSWLSGISTRFMVVISGAILMGLASLAGSALTHYLTKKTLLGLLGGAIIGIIFVFPSYSLLWGRYTQLMGTIMLMIFIISLFIWDQHFNYSLRYLLLLIPITVGLIFSHYRICVAGLIFTLFYLVTQKNTLNHLKKYLINWLVLPFGALLISSPWLIRLIMDRRTGFDVVGVQTKNSFFSLEQRLGLLFYDEIQTWILIGLSITFILIGLIKKDRIIFVISAWLLAIFFITQPSILGHIIDPVTMMVSSYVPIIMLIGLGLSIVFQSFAHNTVVLIIKLIILISLIFGISSGFQRWKTIDFPKKTFLTIDDLEAADWIRNNTDNDSLFLINTYQFPINEHLIISLDAGYWLPVIAERQTVIPPMVYLAEKMSYKQAENDPVKFHLLNSNIADIATVRELRNSGIDYIYLGTRGGNINLESIYNSEYYEHVFHQNGVNIFKVLP